MLITVSNDLRVDLSDYRPQIESALSYAGDTHRYEDVAAMVAAGQAQAWPGPASVIITETIDFPRKRVLNLFLAGGHMAELEAMIPHLVEWAREQGCQSLMFAGRKGWGRTSAIRDGGWTEQLTVFTKEL